MAASTPPRAFFRSSATPPGFLTVPLALIRSTNNTASRNTANGYSALYRNTTGSDNTAVGFAAGINQTSGSNNIYIGDAGVAGESNVIAIGAVASSGTPYAFTYIGGIYDTSCG